MMESGFATAEDIDTGLVRRAAPPAGSAGAGRPDRARHHQGRGESSLYEEFKEPLYAPPPLLARMVDAGLLGRKTGRGFYDYQRK